MVVQPKCQLSQTITQERSLTKILDFFFSLSQLNSPSERMEACLLTSPDMYPNPLPCRMSLVHYNCCGNFNSLPLTLGGLSQKQYCFNAIFCIYLANTVVNLKIPMGGVKRSLKFSWVREGEWLKPWPLCCFLQCVFFMSLVLCSALFSQLPLEGGASEYKNVREKCRQKTQRRLPCCFIGLILGLGNSKLSVTESDYIAQYIQKTPRCFQLIFFSSSFYYST